MNNKPIISRFAPSPTGLLHMGNARTALFNFLFARAKQGRFLLRIEDTDQERSQQQYVEALQQDLAWLDVQADLGPAGENGADYFQSGRSAVYAQYYAQLQQTEQVYPCFCSPEALAMSRKAQRSAGNAPRYAGTCAHLSAAEAAARMAQGEKPTLRFRVPEKETICFEDGVRGVQNFNTQDIGDFIIRRADGTPAFFFCNAVDDSLMGVTHVLRGEDHLTNTPRQLMILRALDLPAPDYAHMSLILGDDGAPLSKRNGSMSLAELRDAGYLPLAVTNFLARLGHRYEQDGLLSLADLEAGFCLDRLGRAPARADKSQLDFYHRQALAELDDEAFLAWCMRHDSAQGLDRVPADERAALIAVIRDNISMPADVTPLLKAFYDVEIDFTDSATEMMTQAGADFFSTAAEVASQEVVFKDIVNAVKEKTGAKGKSLFMPLRMALTGLEHGPELGRMFALRGTSWAEQRFQQALTIIEKD
ncbi:MAG: glutamate--tRNA ligase [gamma proteobacterium symbiont of Bathyaustriella thionipta]|nr:glutamate--tRNA ligase [gamma proteobacterium symbiont of Bathyaustriella thionipta]